MNISMKKGLLALAGAVALAGAGGASAQIADRGVDAGTTTLTAGANVSCTLYLEGSINTTSGAVTIEAAAAEPGGALCNNVVLSNFPWTGVLSNLSGAGTVDLSTVTATIPGLVSCSGTVTASYPGFTAATYPSGYPSTPPEFNIASQVFDPANSCSIVSDTPIDRKIPAQ